MRLAILAADVRLAPLLVGEALARGHDVAVLSDAPAGPGHGREAVRLVPGSQRDAGAVSDLVDGCQGVIVALADGSRPEAVAAAPAVAGDVVRSMRRYGVRRLIVLSTAAVTPGGSGRSRLLGRLTDPLARPGTVAGLRRMEVAVRRSELDWTIVRASRLTDDPPRGALRLRAGPGYSLPAAKPVSRADVAAFLLDELQSADDVGHAVAIGG